MRFRTLTMPLALVLLAGCGDKPTDHDNATSATPEPTSYGIRQADLSLARPNDICRAKHPGFLQDLIARVGRGLPAAMAGTMQFRDFDVTSGNAAAGREATLRFTVDRDGKQGVLMYATGAFDDVTCGISRLRAGVGATSFAPNVPEIGVP
jgi:hypothetical protein